MRPGDIAYIAFIGTDEAGTGMHVRPVKLYKDTGASWSYNFADTTFLKPMYRCCHNNKTRKICETELEAYQWLSKAARRRLVAAQEVLNDRMRKMVKIEDTIEKLRSKK